MSREDDLGPICRELNRQIRCEFNELINSRADGITHSQAFMLFNLVEAEKEEKILFQKDLENIFKVSKSTMSEMITNMEKEDLIQRVPLKKDARLKQIIITSKGRRINAQIGEAIYQFEDEFKNRLTVDERKEFIRLAKKLKGDKNEEK